MQGIRVHMGLALALTLTACAGGATRVSVDIPDTLLAKDAEYENEDGYWRLAAPAEAGLEQAALKANLEAAIRTGADAYLVAKDGAIVCEWYSRRYTAPIPFMSSTKSVASVVCGIMQDEGLLSLDDPVGRYVPEWSQGPRGKVTIRHLLSQTSGLLQGAHPGFYETGGARDAYLRAMEPDAEPGTRWSYSNEGCQLLSPVMEAACGGRLWDYAEERLFRPLGMARTSFQTYANEVWTYADMPTTPRDVARIGFMMMAKGSFRGKRVVSEAYVEEALRPVSPGPRGGYGLLWWYVDRDKGWYNTSGYLDNDMYILPSAGIVVVRAQAPLNGFSGQPESGNYGDLESELLSALVSGARSGRLRQILDRLQPWAPATPEPRGAAAADTPAPAADATAADTSAAAVDSRLDELERQSGDGVVGPVVAGALAVVESAAANRAQKARAWSLLTMAYIRQRDKTKARHAMDRAKEAGLADLGGWYTQSIPQIEGMIDALP